MIFGATIVQYILCYVLLLLHIHVEGPFLILCEMDTTVTSTTDHAPVYWIVDENYELWGTTNPKYATLFYIISTGDLYHPFEFHIAIWDRKGDRKSAMNLTDMYRNHTERNMSGPCLPRYLSTNCSLLCRCEGPLKFNTTVELKQARFTLYSRIQNSSMICGSTPVSMTEWIEGEQFYINCRRSLQIGGYIVMEKQPKCEETEEQVYSYKSTTVTTVTAKDPTNIGMLFRLQSPEILKLN